MNLRAFLTRTGALSAAALLCACCLFASTARARTNSYDVFTLRAAGDGSPYFSVYGSETHDQFKFTAGMFFDYAHKPLELTRGSTVLRSIIDGFFSMQVTGAFGMTDWAEAGLAIPVVLYNKFTDPVTAVQSTKTTMGDIELNFKFRILDRAKYKFGVAVLPFVRFPTGNSDSFAGTGNFTGGGTVIGDFAYKRVRAALNVGVLGRKSVTRAGTSQGTSLLLGAAGQVRIIRNLFAIAELTSSSPFSGFFQSQRKVPFDAQGGFRYILPYDIAVEAGGGAGILRGVGAPKWRAFLGVSYSGKYNPDYDLRDQGMSIWELPVESDKMAFFDLAESCPPPESFVPGVDSPQCEKFYDLALGCPSPEQFVSGRDPEECLKIFNLPELIKGEWNVIYLREDNPFIMTKNIEFKFGRASLTTHAKQILDELSIMLLGQTDIRGLVVEGHTDDVGTERANMSLSKARAESVKRYLVEQGMEDFDLATRGFGKTKPLDTNKTEEGRAKNRRVQFIITNRNGVPLPGVR